MNGYDEKLATCVTIYYMFWCCKFAGVGDISYCRRCSIRARNINSRTYARTRAHTFLYISHPKALPSLPNCQTKPNNFIIVYSGYFLCNYLLLQRIRAQTCIFALKQLTLKINRKQNQMVIFQKTIPLLIDLLISRSQYQVIFQCFLHFKASR